MKNNNILIVLYPYKFTNFLWNLLELDEISKNSNVVVWDVSQIVNNSFSRGISASSLTRKEVVNISSILGLILHIKFFLKRNKGSNICVLNEVARSSLTGILVNIIVNSCFKAINAKVLDLYNGGIPLAYPMDCRNVNSNHASTDFNYRIKMLVNGSTNLKELIYRISWNFSRRISNIFPVYITHRLVAGSTWEAFGKQDLPVGTNLVFGHSHDYSIYLTTIKFPPSQKSKKQRTAVLLDAAGPMFNSDSSLTKRRVFITSEIWYPALSNFFTILEKRTKVIVNVSGHYKSTHISPAPCFGNRNVIYGSTCNMVYHSDYVITRCSTAISYAVIFRKPILFIFSTQLSFDVQAMREINGMAEMLGTTPINIDYFPDDIELYLKVDEAKYAAYEIDVLTSSPLGRPNFQIILEDIMEIPIQATITK